MTTAALLAPRLGESERTVYRDVADLPPLMFTHEEAKALVASVQAILMQLREAVAGREGMFKDESGKNLADCLRGAAPPEVSATWSPVG